MILEAFRLGQRYHVEPGKTDVKVRYRIDGVMHLMPLPPKREPRQPFNRDLKLCQGWLFQRNGFPRTAV
jgi:type II secretory ATPase GspE/PulE/Tfp pilus assembly ATPase PilB-like protein